MTDLGRRMVYSTDNSIYQWTPAEVVAPTSVEELVALVQANAARQQPQSICARGGGTSTNGQSLTDGLAIDTKRHLDQVLAIDVANKRAVVEPGVVAGQLDALLLKDGLFWAPHTSTRSRATVGGMISTDAAGKGSLVHGRTNRHVESVSLVLADGTTWDAEPLPFAEALAESERQDSVGRIWRALIGLYDAGPFELPELARGFSGYGISGVHHDGLVDPIPVICGSEGTLGVLTRATLRLTPIAQDVTLVALSYANLDSALRDAVQLAGSGLRDPLTGQGRLARPTAIEVSDQTTLDRGHASPAWPAFATHLAPGANAVLLVEYELPADSDAMAQVKGSIDALASPTSYSIVVDQADRSAIWKVRADAVGLLANVGHGQPRPTAFVEDCAVPVAAMPDFIAAFRSILDDHNVDYAMFGHADVGCVHVRPALDPISVDHEALVSQITAQVVDLLDQFGGIIWGEHGRGLRSSFVTQTLPAEVVGEMRRIKSAFDPLDLMNPGKLYRPEGSQQPLLGLDDVPRRAAADRSVPVEIRSRFADAFDCNGNGLCHHHAADEVMCPSFKATGDPVQAPKGRTDLLRAWLAANAAGKSSDRDELANAVFSSLETCLSCGACTGHCPVHVDIPELKSRFLEDYFRSHRRPLRDHVVSRFEIALPVLRRLPGRHGGLVAAVARRLGLVDLPEVPGALGECESLILFDPHESAGLDVVVLADAFSSVFDASELQHAVALLEAVGYRTAVSRLVPTAKFEHVKGMRSRVRRAALRQQKLVESVEAVDAVAVCIDPAITLLHRHDYAKVVPDYPGAAVRPIVELLADRASFVPHAAEPRRVLLFGHCTEQSLAPDWIELWATVLREAGHDVRIANSGCCGMAGVFGHEAEHAELSRDVYDLSWQPLLADAPDQWHDVVVATGWSCRSQATRWGDSVVSPLSLLVTL